MATPSRSGSRRRDRKSAGGTASPRSKAGAASPRTPKSQGKHRRAASEPATPTPTAGDVSSRGGSGASGSGGGSGVSASGGGGGSGGSGVRVCLRFRPQNSVEKRNNGRSCTTFLDPTALRLEDPGSGHTSQCVCAVGAPHWWWKPLLTTRCGVPPTGTPSIVCSHPSLPRKRCTNTLRSLWFKMR